MNMIVNCVAYAHGRRVREIALEEISAILEQEDTFVWLGLHEPDENLLQQVQQQFQLHDLAVEDAHAAHQRPKVEVYGDSLFVVLRTAQLQEGRICFGETHIFLGLRYLVTVRHGASLPYTGVRARCERTPELLSLGPGFALYTIMDFVGDNYFPILDGLEEVVTTLEEDIVKAPLNQAATERIYEIKRDLAYLRRAVAPLVEVCEQLMELRLPQIPVGTYPYFRDVHDHLLRINESIDTLREMLTTALQVSVSLASVSQNEVTKRLAGWGAILAVPTMIFSIYGMNFEFMPELRWRYSYAVVIGIVIMFCLLLYRHLKKVKWL